MAPKLFLSVGECMIELSARPDGGYRLGYAGDTLNTAWYARALLPGDWEVAYLTRLGRDAHSARMLEFLAGNGISTRFVGLDPDRQPGLYLIDVAEGERSFTYWRGQSAARHLADDAPALEAAMMAAGVIYVSAITLAILAPDRRAALLAALARARAAGRLTVFDPNIRPRLWEDLETLRQVTMQAAAVAEIALPSFDDEQATFGDASPAACIARYRAAGAGTVVVKNGGGPIHAQAGDRPLPPMVFGRVAPVDTTGAGDSFNGALLAAMLRGDALADAVATAHEVSARVVQSYGALMPMAAIRQGAEDAALPADPPAV